MNVEVIVANEDDEDARSAALRRWLLVDEELRGRVRFPTRPGAAGSMGPVLDIIDAVVSNGVAMGSLAVAIQAWRDSRPGRPRVIIRRGDVSVEVDGDDPESMRAVLRMFDDEDGKPGSGDAPGEVRD